MNDYIHKTTRYIINYCKENNIDTIVIGNNKFQKQNKKKKQIKGLKNFIQVPIKRIKRGIFKRPNGEFVNADVNGSLQILSKVISTKLLEKLRKVVSSNGLALNPLKIAL